jgi:hypothetical protein
MLLSQEIGFGDHFADMNASIPVNVEPRALRTFRSTQSAAGTHTHPLSLLEARIYSDPSLPGFPESNCKVWKLEESGDKQTDQPTRRAWLLSVMPTMLSANIDL